MVRLKGLKFYADFIFAFSLLFILDSSTDIKNKSINKFGAICFLFSGPNLFIQFLNSYFTEKLNTPTLSSILGVVVKHA